MIKLQVKGLSSNRQVIRKLHRIKQDTHQGLNNAFSRIGRDVTGEAGRTMREDPKTGNIYMVRDPGSGVQRSHQASAVGESPAVLSGDLLASLGAIAQSDQVQVGAGGDSAGNLLGGPQGGTVDYARELELDLGRPYLKPSIDKRQGVTKQYFENELKKTLTTL